MGTLPKTTLGVFQLPGITLHVTSDTPNKYKVRARPTEGGSVQVLVTDGPQPGDYVKIAYTSGPQIVEDSVESDDDLPSQVAYGLLCAIEEEKYYGCWSYDKDELEGSLPVGRFKRALTTDEFGPFTAQEMEVIDGEPPDQNPAMMNFANKKMDPKMSVKTYRSIIVTANAVRKATGDDPSKKRKVDIFDMPGHAKGYARAYRTGSDDRKQQMVMWANTLYCSRSPKWWLRIERLHELVTGLDEAADTR